MPGAAPPVGSFRQRRAEHWRARDHDARSASRRAVSAARTRNGQTASGSGVSEGAQATRARSKGHPGVGPIAGPPRCTGSRVDRAAILVADHGIPAAVCAGTQPGRVLLEPFVPEPTWPSSSARTLTRPVGRRGKPPVVSDIALTWKKCSSTQRTLQITSVSLRFAKLSNSNGG
jgi:hypothetical protein